MFFFQLPRGSFWVLTWFLEIRRLHGGARQAFGTNGHIFSSKKESPGPKPSQQRYELSRDTCYPCTFGGTRISKPLNHLSKTTLRRLPQCLKSSTTTNENRPPHTSWKEIIHRHIRHEKKFAKSDQWISPRSEDTRVTQMVTPLNKHVQRTRRKARTTGKHRPGWISRMPKERLAMPFIFFLMKELTSIQHLFRIQVFDCKR